MKMLERLKTKTILVVEDDTVIRTNITSMLKIFFKEVYAAEDGFVGLDRYEANLPDIVMTDLKMPKMDGFELLNELKKRSSDAYKIIVSAHTDKELLIQAIHDNVDRYLIKPLTEEDLFEAFEAYLEKIDAKYSEHITLNDHILLDLEKSIVMINHVEVHLNKKEKLLLKLLCSDQTHTFTYEQIENQVWGSKSMSLAALRSVVRDVRKKLGEMFIINESGIGYRLI
jgi:DNA-binding response OmpR family regulator